MGIRTWFVVAGVVAIGLVIAVGVIWLPWDAPASSTGSDTGQETTAPEAECASTGSSGVSQSEDQAPSSGGIEVIEDGSSLSPGPVDGNTWWLYGVILANTSDLVAVDVEMRFKALGDDGRPAINASDEQPWEYTETLSSIMPGQTFGTGTHAKFLADSTQLNVQLEIEIEVGQWWQVDNDVHDFGELTTQVTNVREGFIDFEVTSSYCEAVAAGSSVIYRDSNGTIIGGYTTWNTHPTQTMDPDLPEMVDVTEYQPGNNQGISQPNFWNVMLTRHAEYETEPDMTKTEIYAYIPTEEQIASEETG